MLVFQEQLHMFLNNEGKTGCDSTIYVSNCTFLAAIVLIWNKSNTHAVKSDPIACVCVLLCNVLHIFRLLTSKRLPK